VARPGARSFHPSYHGLVLRLDPALALALLRITTGLLVFPHGVRKLLKGPVESIGRQVAAQGFPEWFAYVVTLGELAGLLLAVGLYTRFAGAAVALTMAAIAIFTQLGTVGQFGSGKSLALEFLLLLGLSAALFVFLPPTRLSLDGRRRASSSR